MHALVLSLVFAADPFANFLADEVAITIIGPATRGDARIAIGPGRLTSFSKDRAVVEHVMYENNQKRALEVKYIGGYTPADLALGPVERGDLVSSRSEVRYFIDGKRVTRARVKKHKLFDPRDEKRLLLVDHETYELRFYSYGEELRRHKIGFGQVKGVKEVQGDLKTPKGMYFVTGKHRGEFGGKWGAYYGGHWIKVSYPNTFDAERGVRDGVVSQKRAREIKAAFERRALPTQRTGLGGGIGFHGWIEDWSDDDAHLSWGCIVMHNKDIKAIYDEVPVGTMVVIF